MKLINFLNFHYPNSHINSLQEKCYSSLSHEEFSLKNYYTHTNPVESYLNTITLQKNSADNASHPTVGFKLLEKSLKELPKEKLIFMQMIESESWGGRVYFCDKNIIGIFFGKKINKSWKTPTNWDGSVEMLEKYNQEGE